MIEHWRGNGYIGTVVTAHREKWIIIDLNVRTRVVTALCKRDLETRVGWKNPYFMQWDK